MAYKCPHCGADLPEHAAFCPHCARDVHPRREVKKPVPLLKKLLLGLLALADTLRELGIAFWGGIHSPYLWMRCPGFDINAACAGFVFALHLSAAYLAAGMFRRILVISAESMSSLCDWTDRSTCVLFGDGAGAAVVDGGEGGLMATLLTSQGDATHLNMYPDPGNSPFATCRVPARALHMDGPEIYKFAVSHSVSDLRAVCEKAGVALDDIDHFLLHQANKRIIDAARVRLKQPIGKFPMNVEVRGNTSSASVPILLDEVNRAGRLHAGDKLAMSAFGAGLTTGACVLTWTKE